MNQLSFPPLPAWRPSPHSDLMLAGVARVLTPMAGPVLLLRATSPFSLLCGMVSLPWQCRLCVYVVCLGGTAGLRGGVLIGVVVARVNRAVIGLFCLCVHPVLEPSGEAAIAPSEVWSGCT